MRDRFDYDYISRMYLSPRYMHAVASDRDPGDILGGEIESREELYTTLLRNYSIITCIRNILKEVHKWLFFWAVIVVGGIITSLGSQLISKVLAFNDANLFLESVPVLIVAFVAFVSTVIVVPLTITNFLFNIEEDKNITSTIHATQEHDFKEIHLLKDRYIGKNKSKTSRPPKRRPVIFDDDFESVIFDNEEDYDPVP